MNYMIKDIVQCKGKGQKVIRKPTQNIWSVSSGGRKIEVKLILLLLVRYECGLGYIVSLYV